MAFQLGGDRKLLTASVSEDAGPPLKSFLFDVEDNRFEAYGKYCLVRCAINQWRTSRRNFDFRPGQAALAHVSTSFPGLDLHDRVCVAVPDDVFRRQLLETGAFDSYRVRTAAGASAELINSSLVVDAIDNLDGLERLVVICCGLDAVKDATRSSCWSAAVAICEGGVVRSMELYWTLAHQRNSTDDDCSEVLMLSMSWSSPILPMPSTPLYTSASREEDT